MNACREKPRLSFSEFMEALRTGQSVSRETYVYSFEWDNEKSRQLLECLDELQQNKKTPNLTDADLCGAEIPQAKLPYAYMVRANLSGAILVGADMRSARLQNAIVNDTDLTDADLTGASLDGVNLFTAITDGVKGVKAISVMIIFHMYDSKGEYFDSWVENFIVLERGDVVIGTRHICETIEERVPYALTDEFGGNISARLHSVVIY